MKKPHLCSLLLTLVIGLTAIPSSAASKDNPSGLCPKCIEDNLRFLASDGMKGRGSATEDEQAAATYVASKLKEYGAQPAGDDGGYIQRATVLRRKITAAPQLKVGTIELIYGKDFLVPRLANEKFSGPLRKLDGDDSKAGEDPNRCTGGSRILRHLHLRLRFSL